MEEKLNAVIEILLEYMKTSPKYHNNRDFHEQLIERLEELE